MARYWFGGGVADWSFGIVTVSGTANLAQVAGGATITFWTAETGGAPYEDLLDSDGAAVSVIESADGTVARAAGQIPPFQGPDEVGEMWASANDGPRALLVGRRPLGLGSSATRNVGTTAGTVAAGDDSRILGAVPRSSRVIFFGDSTDQDGGTSGRWIQYLVVNSSRMVRIGNAGVSGDRTDQMLLRLPAVLALNPDIVVLGSVTNDLGNIGNAALGSLAVTKANIVSMVNSIRAAGIVPVLRTTLPADTAGNNAPYNTIAGRRAGTQDYNAWLRAYATANGIGVLDVYEPTVNAATGGFIAGYASDGVHPTEDGHLAIANGLIAAGLPTVFHSGGNNLAMATGDPANLLINPLFLTDTNADGLSDSWTTVGAASYSRTLGTGTVKGYWQRVTGADTTAYSIYQDITTGYAVGDMLELSVRVRMPGGATNSFVRLLLNGLGTSSAFPFQPAKAIDGVTTMRITVAAGTTGVRTQIQTGGAAGYIEVAQATLRNLTALGQ